MEREEGEECEENMEVFDDSSSSPSGTLRNYPLTCKVLYSYKVRASHDTHTRTPLCIGCLLLLLPPKWQRPVSQATTGIQVCMYTVFKSAFNSH